MADFLDPVKYWAATSGIGSNKNSMTPFQNFSSNVARDYGSNFGSYKGHGGQYGIGTTAGFEPSRSATRSLVQGFLEDRRTEADMATKALGAMTNIAIGGLQPQAGGGAQPKQPGFGKQLLNTAVAAGVPAVVGLI